MLLCLRFILFKHSTHTLKIIITIYVNIVGNRKNQ